MTKESLDISEYEVIHIAAEKFPERIEGNINPKRGVTISLYTEEKICLISANLETYS